MIEVRTGAGGIKLCACVRSKSQRGRGQIKTREGMGDGGGEAGGEAGVFKCKGGRGDGGGRTLDPVF